MSRRKPIPTCMLEDPCDGCCTSSQNETPECTVYSCPLLAPFVSQLVTALEVLLDLTIFMSGSTDFSPGGKGREGWLKLKPAVDLAREALAKITGEGDR